VRVMRGGHAVQKEDRKRQFEITEKEDARYVAGAARDIVVGDKVKLRSFGSIGIVDSLKGDEAEVRVKSLRFREKLDNLELVEMVAPSKSQTEKFASLRDSRGTQVHLKVAQQNGRSELNVIGQTTDQAVDAVDKFLDEASLASLSQVRIVHGHGTGALRRAIAELLKDHPHVARFAAAPQDQGGTGATMVELRV
jgi:DNA mismatch repair protein MutS2